MELLEVVDENNKLTGIYKEREEIHAQNLWHRHAHCWLINSKYEILLQKRSANRGKNPNKWSRTGGHVLIKENPLDALIREIKEELGITVNKRDIEFVKVYKSKEDNNHYFGYEYIVRIDAKLEDFQIQKEELSAVKYISLEALETLYEAKDPNYIFSSWLPSDFYEHMDNIKNYIKRKIG